MHDDEEDGQARNLCVEDARKIEEAMACASNLVKWKRISEIGIVTEDTENNTEESNGFVGSKRMKVMRFPYRLTSPPGDFNDDLHSPSSDH